MSKDNTSSRVQRRMGTKSGYRNTMHKRPNYRAAIVRKARKAIGH